MSNLWRNRALVLAGILITGLSIHSIVQLSTNRTSDNQNLSQVLRSKVTNTDENNDNEEHQLIRIGWTAWADADVVSLMAKKLIEAHYEQPVERVMADIGIQYEAVARGDIDLMLMAWLPKTHHQYWIKVRNRVLDLGTMYTGRLGWVLPNYVPEQEISTIGDLAEPKIGDQISNKVQGIDPGSGLMQASEKAFQVYELSDLKLVSASGAAMTAVLDRAIRDNQWVVVTGWTPHWMFARYQLRFLEDPKRVFGGLEGIHAIARMGLDQDHPKVVAFLSRFHLPDDQLAALLLAAQESSPEQAVNNYLDANPSRVDYWMNGTIKEPNIKAETR